MRARLIFSVENPGATIPFHHQYVISRWVKEMIVLDPLYSSFKTFSFSGIKGQTKVGRDGLHILSSKITIVFSSVNEAFVYDLIKKVFSYKRIEFMNLKVRPESVEIENPIGFETQQKYLCISPIVFADPRKPGYDTKRYIVPHSDEFSDVVFESTMQSMEKSGLFSAEQMAKFFRFQIVPDPEYMSKISEEEKKIARIYNTYIQDAKYEVRGYTLPFTLFAEPEVHEFIYNCGVGAITNEGFGMLDVPFPGGKKPTTAYLPPKVVSQY
ncbi:MAG: CRISPR-associated endoribonuclease Cas6 [Cytophagales bacterium]